MPVRLLRGLFFVCLRGAVDLSAYSSNIFHFAGVFFLSCTLRLSPRSLINILIWERFNRFPQSSSSLGRFTHILSMLVLPFLICMKVESSGWYRNSRTSIYKMMRSSAVSLSAAISWSTVESLFPMKGVKYIIVCVFVYMFFVYEVCCLGKYVQHQ